ncbi:hypothetical protein NB693_25290 [Pantoea ananatis]|nr:hypothetical protein [Pantoea ananatis]
MQECAEQEGRTAFQQHRGDQPAQRGADGIAGGLQGHCGAAPLRAGVFGGDHADAGEHAADADAGDAQRRKLPDPAPVPTAMPTVRIARQHRIMLRRPQRSASGASSSEPSAMPTSPALSAIPSSLPNAGPDRRPLEPAHAIQDEGGGRGGGMAHGVTPAGTANENRGDAASLGSGAARRRIARAIFIGAQRLLPLQPRHRHLAWKSWLDIIDHLPQHRRVAEQSSACATASAARCRPALRWHAGIEQRRAPRGGG